MYNKMSKISLFLFIIYYNYLPLRFILFPYIYNNYGNAGIFVILSIIIISFIIFLIIPKKIYLFDYLNKFQVSKIKIIIKPLLFIRTILGISCATYILNTMFFSDYPAFLVLAGFIIVISIISNSKPSSVIQISTLFSIAGLMIYGLYFYDFINMDITQIHYYDMNIFIIILISLGLVIDNLIILLSNKDNLKTNKLTIVSAYIISALIFSCEYLVLILTSGDIIFLDNPLSGFIPLSIQPVSRFNGNFKYVYILMIVVSTVFKFSFYNSIIINKNKYSTKSFIHSIILFALSLFFLSFFKKNTDILNFLYVPVLVLIILPIWFIKEAKNVRLDER